MCLWAVWRVCLVLACACACQMHVSREYAMALLPGFYVPRTLSCCRAGQQGQSQVLHRLLICPMDAQVQVPVALLGEGRGCSVFTATLPRSSSLGQLTDLLNKSLATRQIGVKGVRGHFKFEGQQIEDTTLKLLAFTAGSDAELPRLSATVAEVITVQLQLAGTDRTATVSIPLSDPAHQLYGHACQAFG